MNQLRTIVHIQINRFSLKVGINSAPFGGYPISGLRDSLSTKYKHGGLTTCQVGIMLAS